MFQIMVQHTWKPTNQKMTSGGQILEMYLSSSKSNIQNLVSKIQYDLPNQNNIDH